MSEILEKEFILRKCQPILDNVMKGIHIWEMGNVLIFEVSDGSYLSYLHYPSPLGWGDYYYPFNPFDGSISIRSVAEEFKNHLTYC